MLRGPDAAPLKHPTLGAMLRGAAAEGIPQDGLLFVDLDERESFFSWAEILARAERAAAVLASRGAQPGDRVAMILPTSIGFMDAFFGALLAGCVPVPLYPPVRLGRLEEYQTATVRMLATAGAKLVVIDARVRPVLGAVIERARCDHVEVERLLEAEAAAWSSGVAADALGLIQFSSGSTVDPKAVALTHAQLLAQCAALHGVVQACPANTRVGASWLPLYHDMGLIGCLLSAAYYPGRLVLIAPEHFLARPALWLRAIARHRAFISPAPNFAYAVCAKRIRDADLAGLDLSCWRLALNGAEPVLGATLDAFAARFAPFGFEARALMPVYGLSEAALAVTLTPASRGARRGPGGAISVGVPAAGFSVRIVDPAGAEAPEGVEGRIIARGPSVMTGYFGDAKATARALVDGWLDTGDIGFIADGELYVSGRAKEVLIIRGANRMPQEFEEALADLDGVRAGCVVAVGEQSTATGSEGLLVFAERARGSYRTDAELQAEIAARLVERTGIRPSSVLLLAPGTLPRTSSGKLRRVETLARHRAGMLTPPGAVNAWTMSGALLRSALAFLRLRLRSRAERRP